MWVNNNNESVVFMIDGYLFAMLLTCYFVFIIILGYCRWAFHAEGHIDKMLWSFLTEDLRRGERAVHNQLAKWFKRCWNSEYTGH